MWLARNVPGLSYAEMMHWPIWMLSSRVKHCNYWIDRENKADEEAARRARQ